MHPYLYYSRKYATQLTLVLIALVILITLLFKIFIIPDKKQLHAQQKEESILKQKYIRKFQQQLDYDFIKLQSQELLQRFSESLTKMKRPILLNKIMTELTASINSRSLQLLHIAPILETKNALQINLRGNYHDFLHWLNDIIKLPWFFRFDQIQIQPVPHSSLVIIELHVETCHF